MRHESLSATSAAMSAPASDTRALSGRLDRVEPDQPPRHDARALTAGGTQAEIRLDGVRYLLRITRQGKLILTK